MGEGFFQGEWGALWREIVSICLLLTGRHPEEMELSLTSLWEIFLIGKEILEDEKEF